MDIDHDPDELTLTLEYTDPEGVDPERSIEVILTALHAAVHKHRWADGGIIARGDGYRWHLPNGGQLRHDCNLPLVRLALQNMEVEADPT